MPIPPYLNREAVDEDKVRYNNVYAKDGGSVAAPTAGLHFTPDILKELGDDTSSLTLHVGAGTFMPGKLSHLHTNRLFHLVLFIRFLSLQFSPQMHENMQCMQSTFTSR